ncbi:MAG: hypothetical protein CMG00_03200 [Candidatus Marinimicrobia bacterium]|nr:hypothetical protein [Candidatus Neomarinimicrobiota bacterium]|tara:strand:- start:5078 stop:7168 length:2091 start_codon:yes stop_codon:yes gene_type:complete
MKSLTKNYNGYILFTTIAILGCSTALILGFYVSLGSRVLNLNYKIAKTKALYNAETGIAETAYPFLIKSAFSSDTTLQGKNVVFDGVDMGIYLNPELEFANDGQRLATVEGVSFIRTSKGTLDSVRQKVNISARPEALSKYMYLTESEKAGGAPCSYGPPAPAASNLNQRRFVYFGIDDEMEGLVQSNDDIAMSTSTSCPDFSDATLYMTYQTETLFNNCGGYADLFGSASNIDTVSSPPVKLPPVGYEILKNNATLIYDSGRKIGNGSFKDTLIMTDIQFNESGMVNIKQWWYLMPPHLKAGLGESDLFIPGPEDLDGVTTANNGNLIYDGTLFNPNTGCGNSSDIRTCRPYIDSLYYYHSRGYNVFQNDNMPSSWVNRDPELEDDITPTVSGPHGVNQHFDFEPLNGSGNPNNSSLLIDDQYFITNPTVIYIKDGPVRVHGRYKGQFTIVTDEHTTYRRHAWNSFFNVKIDTVWNNIWITDDLINIDAIGLASGGNPNHDHGNLTSFQPTQDCSTGGSKNIMGLVSGANVIIANTSENGAGGCNSSSSDLICNISINAAILALNESFVMHFWQNTLNYSRTEQFASIGNVTGEVNSPPWADGRGPDRFGSNNQDKRGEIYLWGSVVQKHRGYMLRNTNSQYGDFFDPAHSIGMDKNYHYDNNLFCTPPPFYPAVEYDDGTGEIGVRLTGFKAIE